MIKTLKEGFAQLHLLLLWQVNQKMILMLTASIMYWSLQQRADDPESSATTPDASPAPSVNGDPSPSPAFATSPDASSPVPSFNGDDESLSVGGVSSLSIHDAASIPSSSRAPSINGDDESSSIGGDVSSLTADDATPGATEASQVEHEETSLHSEE